MIESTDVLPNMNRFLQRSHDALQECAGRLTLEQLTARPPGKWTIGEILEHLSRAYSHTTAGAQRALAEGKPLLRPTGFASRLRAIVVVECSYLPTGVESPKMVVPIGIDPATALTVATEALRQMNVALDEAAARFGSRTNLMNHPIIGPLTVRRWRKFHWVHTRHHVRQIIGRLHAECGS